MTGAGMKWATSGMAQSPFPDALRIRNLQTTIEETAAENGRPLNTPSYRVAVAAVIANPWVDRDYVSDLQPVVQEICPPLAVAMMAPILRALGPDRSVEAFGKGVVVGAAGEVEHGAALIHTPFFSDIVRRCVDGTAVIASTEAIGMIGAWIHVPLCHTRAATTRSHYQAMAINLRDAPHEDEIVVIVTASTGPRGNARIGDRKTDPPFDAGRWAQN